MRYVVGCRGIFTTLPASTYPDTFARRKCAEDWTLGGTETSRSRFSAFTSPIYILLPSFSFTARRMIIRLPSCVISKDDRPSSFCMQIPVLSISLMLLPMRVSGRPFISVVTLLVVYASFYFCVFDHSAVVCPVHKRDWVFIDQLVCFGFAKDLLSWMWSKYSRISQAAELTNEVIVYTYLLPIAVSDILFSEYQTINSFTVFLYQFIALFMALHQVPEHRNDTAATMRSLTGAPHHRYHPFSASQSREPASSDALWERLSRSTGNTRKP